MSLENFISKHQQKLPLKVRVMKGYCGEHIAIANGDEYTLHFLKSTVVFTVQVSPSESFTIPLNSAIKLGILYNPVGNTEASLHGYKYHAVSDLMTAIPLPLLVRATKEQRGKRHGKVKIAKDELFAVNGVVNRGKGGGRLSVYSISQNKQKALKPKWVGHFTTKPTSVFLFPPEFLEHVGGHVPVQVILRLPSRSSFYLPNYLQKKPVTIVQCSTEESVITTSARNLKELSDEAATGAGSEDHDGHKKAEHMVDIPVNFTLEVQEVKAQNPEDQEELYMDTHNLYVNFDPSNIVSLREDRSQSCINAAIRPTHSSDGILLSIPPSLASSERTYQPLTMPSSSSEPPAYTDLFRNRTMSNVDQIQAAVAVARNRTVVTGSTAAVPVSSPSSQGQHQTQHQTQSHSRATTDGDNGGRGGGGGGRGGGEGEGEGEEEGEEEEEGEGEGEGEEEEGEGEGVSCHLSPRARRWLFLLTLGREEVLAHQPRKISQKHRSVGFDDQCFSAHNSLIMEQTFYEYRKAL